MGLARLGRTLSHLKARQLAAQVGLRIRSRLEDPARIATALPEDGELPPVRWAWRAEVELPHPDGVPVPADEARRGRFTFLGEGRELGRPVRWRDEGASRLWRYHLQDHGFLLGLDFALARELTLDYLEHQPPARGAEGWEPYPLSLRLGNWLCAFFGRWREETLADEAFARRLWLELRRMAIWLERHPETHLLANHLLENAVAMALFGACFRGALPERVGAAGRRWLAGELTEQVLADGGHVERSPMYQQRVLFTLGLLVHSADPELGELAREPAARMLGWLEAMTHPDGGISLFNDAALEVYPSTRDLARWLSELGVRPEKSFEAGAGWGALQASGYFTARNTAGDALFLDAGAVGPDYQPGHAHADFLSFELSLGGARFVVDGGNKEYVASADRAWARSVRAHSTVFVDGQEPLELWGAFRVGRRGKPTGVTHAATPEGELTIAAAHTGYRHLPGSPTPERHASWSAPGCLLLRDQVRSSAPHACTSQLRVDADWHAEARGPDRVHFVRHGVEAWILSDGEIELTGDRSFPRFGEQRPAHLLRRRLEAGSEPKRVEWVLGRDAVLGTLAEHSGRLA